MASPDLHRRARPVVAWAVALVTLAVTVPLLALVLRDAPETPHHGVGSHAVEAPSYEPSPSAPSASAEPVVREESVSSRAAERAAPTRALFFGDSYFIGGGYTGEDNSMAKLAGNRLGWVSEVNGGGGTGFVQTNYEYDLGNYLDQIAEGAFDVGRRRWVVIEGGNNDVGQPMDLVRANARKVVRIAQRTFPNARIVLVGPLDTDADHSNLRPMIRMMRGVAAKRGVPFVPMTNWLGGHYDLIGPDYVHPYPKGHRICARKLARALRALGA